MAAVRAGVVTGVEVNSSQVMAGTSNGGRLLDNSPATWALVWFIVALVVLFFVV